MAKEADRASEAVETMARVAWTFTADEIGGLVDILGEDKILELSVLIKELEKSRLLDILHDTTE